MRTDFSCSEDPNDLLEVIIGRDDGVSFTVSSPSGNNEVIIDEEQIESLVNLLNIWLVNHNQD